MMFYGRMRYETLAKPTRQKDRLNFSTAREVQQVEDIRIYIVRNTQMLYQSNELNLKQSEYVGYTDDPRPQEGWIVADRYVVTDVMRDRQGYVLSLDSLGNPADLIYDMGDVPTSGNAQLEWGWVE